MGIGSLARAGRRRALCHRHRRSLPYLLAPGLLLGLLGSAASPVGASEAPVTFTRDVMPILQENCQECHRPGGYVDVPFMTYEQVKAKGEAIAYRTSRREMPPWKAAPNFGEFLDVRHLTDQQISTIARWVEAGMPEGDPKDLPPRRHFVEGWMLGTPDLVLDAGESYEVPDYGADEYRDFVLPYQTDTDQWITGVEVVPGASEVVHHVILYVDPEGQSPDLDDADPGLGFTVNGADAGFSPAAWIDSWGPGTTPRFLPEGTAWKIPAHSRLVMQVHYHPNGHVQQDRTRIGLHFARGPIDKRVRTGTVTNFLFQIPPGAKRHRVTANLTLRQDITMLSVWPHMHMIGKEMKVSAALPGGKTDPLVWVPDWNFHWQQTFSFKEPRKLPSGTRLDLTAIYDNSADNPYNPNDPPQPITFGPQSTDEMCFCFFRYTLDREHLLQGIAVERDGIEFVQ